MLKRSPASKEQLSLIIQPDIHIGMSENSKNIKQDPKQDSKSSSEGFSSTDNASSTSTSIEEHLPKDSIKSSGTAIENITISKDNTTNFEDYKFKLSPNKVKPEFLIEIPKNGSNTSITNPSPSESNIDPIDFKALPKGALPLEHTQQSMLNLPIKVNHNNSDDDEDELLKSPYPFTAATDLIPNSQQRSIPMVSRHNTFPQATNEIVYTRQSMVTTATDRSSMAKFNDIDTIKIPDRYQKAELTQQAKRHSEATVNSSNRQVTNTNRASKSASFINTKRKADALYHIPASHDRQQLTESDYVKVYDLVTGIRSSVSRCSKAPPTIKDEHFNHVSKLIFDRDGNSQAPPTKYEFKFKDYSPEVFRDLRSMFGISQAEYLMSFQDEVGVRQYGSSGKSGSCFYYSNDQKFIIKTVHHAEHLHLRRILRQYYKHVKTNPNTFLCQFYGLHRLKVPTATGSEKIHILVMNNIFPPNKKMHRTYDLKGSTLGRKTLDPDSCGKDLNFLENRESINISAAKLKEFEAQLKKDINLLKVLNIMDYSLLLGIHELSQGIEDEHAFGLPIRGFVDDHYQRNKILDSNGGIRGTGENNENLDVVYYLGVIDCLTNYSTRKRLETFFRTLKYDRNIISAVPPDEYSKRFLHFVFDAIKTPEKGNKKSGFQKIKASIKKGFKQE